MKKILLFFVVVLLFFTTTAFGQGNEADKIIGFWQTESKDGKIKIYKSSKDYYGNLVWGKDMFEKDGKTSKKDIKNPDEKLKKRNLQDLQILNDFTYQENSWEGKIYDPESGKTYNCIIKYKNGKLEIRGYIGISLFGRTVIWQRVE